MRLIGSIGRIALRGLTWLMYAIWALAGLCLLFYAALWAYISYVELPGSDRHLADASAINGRGDVVAADTERDGTGPSRTKTVIRITQAGHWFATTLIAARSENYLVGFKWRGDDRLVLILDFGCDAKLTGPLRRVGPVQIVYRFDRAVILPDHGYSSFERAPRSPCR